MIERIRTFIETIETKDFYKYITFFLIGIILISGAIVFQYYRKVKYWKGRIKIINELREDDVKVIREKAQHVQQQRAEVDAILAEDEDFKIGGYFKDLLTKLQLTDKKIAEETTQIDREDNYRESELDAKFEDMNMKQLAELLQEIEQNKRIFSKKLEITKSKKNPGTIEVQITIATLLPETELTE